MSRLHIGQAGRYHHFPTRLQLVDQRNRNEIGSGPSRSLCQRGRALTNRDSHWQILSSTLLQPCCRKSLFRRLTKLFDYFKRSVPCGPAGARDGGLIAKTGTDFEETLSSALMSSRSVINATMKGLRDRLLEADWKWNIGIRVGPELRLAQTHAAAPLHIAVMTRSSKALLPIVSRSANAQAAITASMCFAQGFKIFCFAIGNFQSD